MDSYGQRLTLLTAARIDELRTERGMSLEALAELAGLHRTSVGLIVRGRRGLSIDSAAALAGALGCSLTELLEPLEQQLRAD